MEQKFEFKGNLVRMKTDENEQYWFAGIDVCNILGLENPTQTVESLDSDEKKLDYVIDSSGQQRKTGLYSSSPHRSGQRYTRNRHTDKIPVPQSDTIPYSCGK